MLLPNCPQAVITYYAALHLGAMVVMINPLAARREILDQIHRTGAKIAVVLDHLAPKMEQIRPELKLRHLLVTSLADYLPFPWNWLYTFKSRWDRQQVGPRRHLRQKNFRIFSQKIKATPPLAARSQDIATLQYTGGTTGIPKAAILTHRNLVSNVLQINAGCPIAAAGRNEFWRSCLFFMSLV